MIVLGISLGFNSSASVFVDDKCIASISQERLTGVRNTKQIPLEAAKFCLDMINTEHKTITLAFTHYEELSHTYLLKNRSGFAINEKESPIVILIDMIEKFCNVKVSSYLRIEHHDAHAYSAYAVYGYEKNSTTLTVDGFGDGISARLTINDKVCAELDLEHSPALYYQFVTGALGFKEHQHEGKITGLATGKYIDEDDSLVISYYSYFMSLYYNVLELDALNDEEIEMSRTSAIIDFDKFLQLKKTIYRYVKSNLPENYSVDNILQCKEAIAFAVAVQKFAEKIVMSFLRTHRISITKSIYLAGGMFANVALNRLFGEEYENVYISPAMGDEGGAIGSAAACVGKDKLKDFNPHYIIAGGLEITDSHITPNETIVKAIIDKSIVHLCTGRSEYGPRALMHRSSLFPATVSRYSDILNRAMHRNEFMPYAPVCRAESCDDLFLDWKPFEKSLHFMTVALFVKPEIREKYFGGVHKDGTCRVQVVHSDVECEKQAWNILKEYERLTDEVMLINTSFNMHNEPTCCTKEQCNSAWERSGGLGVLFFKKEEL